MAARSSSCRRAKGNGGNNQGGPCPAKGNDRRARRMLNFSRLSPTDAVIVMDSDQMTAEPTPADDERPVKTAPVILITGTPGTGKTTHAQLVVQLAPIPMRHISVGELVKEKDLHEGYDEEWQSYIVDEDKVL